MEWCEAKLGDVPHPGLPEQLSSPGCILQCVVMAEEVLWTGCLSSWEESFGVTSDCFISS